MLKIRMPIPWVLKRIERADLEEINEIVTSLLKCSNRINKEYELTVLSLPKYDTEERSRQIDCIAACLKKEYTGRKL
ncbi:MAG: hypothetical protein J6J12_01730 [Oscillospiraceae bacterium]|nr:hypothetical protein [Oscillospiraceae bacterium]